MKQVDAHSLEVKHNVEARRFEVALGEKLGVIQYRKEGPTYLLVHTEVPLEYRGQGVADRMAYIAFETIKAEGGKIAPYCSFIGAYLRRHPEYRTLVAS